MNAESIEGLVRPCIRSLCPYSTARDEYQGKLGVFLDANESPFSGTGYNRYPDPRQKELKKRISELKGVPASQVFIGNGSDEAIDLVYRIFCTPGEDEAIVIQPSYGMYTVAADINDVKVKQIPLEGENFSLPRRAIFEALSPRTKVLFLCSPNNPSGNAFPADELRSLISDFPAIVVLDEAYADFSSQGSLRGELDSYPNLVILQTMSKAWALAGLRLGLAFASERIIGIMNNVKYPYNINASAQQLALNVLDSGVVAAQVQTIVAQRERVREFLSGFDFIEKVYPSDANFLLVKTTDALSLYSHLIADGIIVRSRDSVPGCRGCLRITIGLPEENDKLYASLCTYKTPAK